jgi:hypothetical protein
MIKKKDLIINIVGCVIIILILICIIKLGKLDPESLEMRLSKLTNKFYGIQEDLPNSEEALKMIGRLELFIDKLINYLDTKYPRSKDVRVDRLIKRLHDIKLEESPDEQNTSSYTINKGELIALCVRKKDTKDIHDYELLKFVVIHELAHVASISTGHNNEFIINFKWLLQEAKEAGIYQPIDYSKKHITYCGVKVTNNPML